MIFEKIKALGLGHPGGLIHCISLYCWYIRSDMNQVYVVLTCMQLPCSAVCKTVYQREKSPQHQLRVQTPPPLFASQKISEMSYTPLLLLNLYIYFYIIILLLQNVLNQCSLLFVCKNWYTLAYKPFVYKWNNVCMD